MSNIKKYNQFVNEEVGMRNMKTLTEGYKQCEIYFHQDLDGICSLLAMKNYLKTEYNISLYDCHIIQYGGIQYAIKKATPGIMPVLVDYANFSTMFTLASDHHSTTRGVSSVKSAYAKPARSNAETLSGEIPRADAFPAVDLKLIQTVDSADFLSNKIKPEDISRSIFNLDKTKTASENRYMMGFVVNRLILAYKNKLITVKSLDGKREHVNRNLLECLGMDCNPSLISLYTNIKHYINNATAENWDRKTRQYEVQKLTSVEDLQKNQDAYVNRMKEYKDLKFDAEYGINMQTGGGNMFDPGSYDRYTVFRNNPDIDFNIIVWPMGLLQVSCNPFKEKVLEGIDLGAIAKEVLGKFEPQLKKIFISIADIKRISEMDIAKFDKVDTRVGRTTDRLGFRFEDLVAFYKDNMKYQPGLKMGDRSLKSFDSDSKEEFNVFVKEAMDKLHSDLTPEERKEISNVKISAWDIIIANSGGHKSISNISGLNLLDARKDGLKMFFGIDSYVDFIKMLQNELLENLKTKIDAVRKGEKIESGEEAWGNTQLTESKKGPKHIKEVKNWLSK